MPKVEELVNAHVSNRGAIRDKAWELQRLLEMNAKIVDDLSSMVDVESSIRGIVGHWQIKRTSERWMRAVIDELIKAGE